MVVQKLKKKKKAKVSDVILISSFTLLVLILFISMSSQFHFKCYPKSILLCQLNHLTPGCHHLLSKLSNSTWLSPHHPFSNSSQGTSDHFPLCLQLHVTLGIKSHSAFPWPWKQSSFPLWHHPYIIQPISFISFSLSGKFFSRSFHGLAFYCQSSFISRLLSPSAVIYVYINLCVSPLSFLTEQRRWTSCLLIYPCT
jgi:hypothetical protein